MKLSVVIVNYNVRFYLEQCLRSVKKAIQGLQAEVWVVDNHSSDGSLEYLRPRFPWVNFVPNLHNEGFPKPTTWRCDNAMANTRYCSIPIPSWQKTPCGKPCGSWKRIPTREPWA